MGPYCSRVKNFYKSIKTNWKTIVHVYQMSRFSPDVETMRSGVIIPVQIVYQCLCCGFYDTTIRSHLTERHNITGIWQDTPNKKYTGICAWKENGCYYRKSSNGVKQFLFSENAEFI